MLERPPIPEAVKREVRRMCRFGCVICGRPIYDIDHIVDYAIVKEHAVDNLVLLCQNHHREKTNGWLTIEEIKKHKANPYNLKHGISSPFGFRLVNKRIDVFMGNNHFSKKFYSDNDKTFPVVVDDKPLIILRRESDYIYLSIYLYDNNNKLILAIEDNEIVFSTEIWDIKFEGQRISLSNMLRKKFIDFHFDTLQSAIFFTAGDFFFNGWHITIESNRYLSLVSPTESKSISGMSIGDSPIETFGCIMHDDPNNPARAGIILGESPSFAGYLCMMRLG